MAHPDPAALPRFVVLYGATFAAFGVASPFFPALLQSRGLTAEQISVTLAAGTVLRLLSAPLAARLGEARGARRHVLVASAALAALVTFGLWPVHGLWALVVLGSLHAATLAPVTVLADALALTHARPGIGHAGFEYGWVRGTGSAAFVAGMLLAGQAVNAAGLTVILQLQAVLLVATTISASVVPDVLRDDRVEAHPAGAHFGEVVALLRSPSFRGLVLAAALVLGSHAMHDAFAVIRWRAAGIGAGMVSVLWSESVVAEVLVFLALGPAILSRLGPAAAIAIAAAAAVLRWTVLAVTSEVALLALVEPLHGLTFALFHLSAMRLVSRIAPPRLHATALAAYGTLGIGLATASLTLLSGRLYARIGPQGFWVMAALAAAALPVTARLRGERLHEVGPSGTAPPQRA